MNTNNDKMKLLKDGHVWRFAKQDVSFDNAFRAAKLFDEIPNKDNVNIEHYYEQHYIEYGITSNRHRVLSTSQLYGLLTKNPFYKRGTQYSKEVTTKVYSALNSYEIGDYQYNTQKTEQILKIKMKAIIDTTDYCEDWNVYAVIFAYRVLDRLAEIHSIYEVPIPMFNTFVMTCSSYDELDDTIRLIASNPDLTDYRNEYADVTRFINILNENTNLFELRNDKIRINKEYSEYFQKLFFDKYDVHKLNQFVDNDKLYADFLYTPQNFGVNLIEVPTKGSVVEEEIAEDVEYIAEVDAVSEDSIESTKLDNMSKETPKQAIDSKTKVRPRDPKVGKYAIKKVNYQCEFDSSHKTFTSASTGKPYMEAHHLIPMPKQDEMWERFGVNIDCVENVVSLCPNCHRATHLAELSEKKKILSVMIEKRKGALIKLGINVDFDDYM